MEKKIKLFLLFLIILCILIYIFIVKSTFNNSKQKIYIVSFAHNCCVKAQKNLEKTAKEFGADKVYSLNLESLEAPEEVKNYIRDDKNKRGAGYWIWKPYAMKQILKISEPGDIIIYVDSSTFFNKSINNITGFINNNSILCFKHAHNAESERAHKQSEWTKMNAVKHFGYSANSWCSTEGEKVQFISAFLGIKNNNIGNFVVDKWLEIMNPKFSYLFDDSISEDNCEGFEDSRHDQQMLSLILYKYFPDILFPDYDKNKYGWVWHEQINGNNRHL